MNTTTETPRIGDWMQTHSGKRFYPLNPRESDIEIQDIAHALSMLCRFGGHCRQFYSVAQHSVIVSRILPPHLKLAGLLHDATEAYLVDLPRPIKQQLPAYKELEHRLESIIAVKFGVDFSDPEIKRADNIALMTEARDLLSPQPVGWGYDEEPEWFKIDPVGPGTAEAMFIQSFKKFTNGNFQ